MSQNSTGPRRNTAKTAINYASSNQASRFILLPSPPCSLQTSNTSPAHPPKKGKEGRKEGRKRRPHEPRRARQDPFCLCGILLLSIQSPLSLGSSIIFATPLGEGLAGLAVSCPSHWPAWGFLPSEVNLHHSFISKDLVSPSSSRSIHHPAEPSSLQFTSPSSTTIPSSLV